MIIPIMFFVVMAVAGLFLAGGVVFMWWCHSQTKKTKIFVVKVVDDQKKS